MAESRRLRTQAALIAEATRWRVLLPVGALKGITEADAYRLAAEYHVRPDRAWVRLYADGTEELGPWSPAPMLPRRLRTQAERDTDGTTCRTGGIVPGEPAILLELSTPVTLDELAEIKDRLSQPGRPVYITAGLKITRRRWWHRYTRRNP